MLDYLQNQDGFIQLSLEDYNPGFESWISLSNGVNLRLLDAGVLEVSPARTSEKAYVLSCGVHGNETAPIEIISHQISKIVTGSIEPKCHLLYILGNPESMRIADRFVSINMNRLFAGAFKSYELTQETRYEIERAEALEQQVGNFFNKHIDATKTHLDLHTAIKPSFHKTFAIRPFSSSPINPQAEKLLLALGIEAFLQHNKPSTTFSAFSVEKFSAEAYTLELGKVRPFGQNNPEDFKAAISCLERLVQDQNIPEQHPENLIEYEVVAEIMKNSGEFKFYIADNVENFTAYPRGYLIAEDFDYTYRVTSASESVVFPNINVPIGQRVAVMVRQVDTH